MKTDNGDLCADNQLVEKRQVSDDSVINVNISDVILTPLTCASLVNEILKGLLYQKCQIPYPYSWLKSVVNKKRQRTEDVENKKQTNFTVSNHYRVVSAAYDALENIMKGISREFNANVREVIVLFGPTPQCPKEIFTIKMSSLAKGHSERNHINLISKYQQKILRNIFLSQTWMDAIDGSITCTNTYIYLKKDLREESSSTDNSEMFIPSKPLTFSPKLKHLEINLNYENSRDDINCCKDLLVFEDAGGSEHLRQKQLDDKEESEKGSVMWYQAKDLLKGFKDCYINKVSACELW